LHWFEFPRRSWLRIGQEAFPLPISAQKVTGITGSGTAASHLEAG
jgi:hypothetical protein